MRIPMVPRIRIVHVSCHIRLGAPFDGKRVDPSDLEQCILCEVEEDIADAEILPKVRQKIESAQKIDGRDFDLSLGHNEKMKKAHSPNGTRLLISSRGTYLLGYN